MVEFDFAQTDGKSAKNWAVLKVIPDPYTATDIEQFTPIYWGQPSRFLPALAGARVLSVLSGKLPDGPLSCFAEVRNSPFNPPPVYEQFRTFSAPCVAICRVEVHPAGIDRAKVEAAYLIPDGWADQVKPALDFWRENPKLFADADAKANRDRLLALVKGENPLLAVFAARTLARAGELKVGDLPKEVLRR